MESGDGTRCVHGGHSADGRPGRRCTPARCCPTTFHLGPPDDRAARPTSTAGPATRPGARWRRPIGALDGGECVVFASGMAAVAAVLRLAARAAARSSCRPTATTSRARWPTPSSPARRRDPRGAHRRPVARPRAGRRDAAARRDPVQPRPRRLRHRRARRRRPRRRRAAWPSTTPPPPRSASARSRSAPTSPSPATPRRWPATATSLLGHVSTADPALAAAPARAAHPQRRRARPDGGLARPPRARHARPAPGPPGRQRRRARPRCCARTPPSTDVRWPGLPDDPSHDARPTQMRRWNGVLRFTLPSSRGREPVPRRLPATPRRPPASAACARSADRRQRWGDAVPPGLLRLLRRLRGHRRPRRRRRDRPRRRAETSRSAQYHTRVTRPRYGLIRAGRWSRAASEIRPTRPAAPTPNQGRSGGPAGLGVLPTGSRVLLLNATFEPLAVVTAKRAVVLMLTGKAECVQATLEGPSTPRTSRSPRRR